MAEAAKSKRATPTGRASSTSGVRRPSTAAVPSKKSTSPTAAATSTARPTAIGRQISSTTRPAAPSTRNMPASPSSRRPSVASAAPTRRASTAVPAPERGPSPTKIVADLKAEIETLTAKCQDVAERLDEKHKQLESRESELTDIRAELERVQKELDSQAVRHATEKEQLGAQLAEFQTRQDNEFSATLEERRKLEDDKAELERVHAQAVERLQLEMQSIRTDLEGDKMALTDQIASKEKEISKLKQDMEILQQNIEEMKSLHENRVAAIQDQLRTQHTSQLDKLHEDYKEKLAELEKQLPDHETMEAQREELKKRLQNAENASAELRLEYQSKTEQLRSESEDRLIKLKENHEKQLEDILTNHREQMDTLTNEHDARLRSLQDTHQQAMESLRQSMPDVENLALEIEQKYNAKFEQEIAAERQKHETMINNLKEVNSRIMQKYSALESKASQDKAEMDHVYQETLRQQLAKEREQMEAAYAIKLDKMEKDHAETLQKQSAVSKKQVDAMIEQHEAALKALEQAHASNLDVVKDQAAAAARAECERELQNYWEEQKSTLIGTYDENLKKLQEEHRTIVARLEADIAVQRGKEEKLVEAQQQEISKMKAEREADISVIRCQVAAELKEKHESELLTQQTKSKSEMEELKRQHILQRDRERATHNEELANLKKRNTEATITQSEHESIIQAIDSKHAAELARLQEQNAALQEHQKTIAVLQAEKEQAQNKNREYEALIKQMKEQHKQRISEIADSHATVLAGFNEEISNKAAMQAVFSGFPKLQDMMARQKAGKSTGSNDDVAEEAQRQIGAIERLLAEFGEKTGLEDHRPRPSSNKEDEVVNLEIKVRNTEFKKELQEII